MLRPLRVVVLACALLGMALLMVVLRHVWLPWIGEALVKDEGPAKAGIAVVLAGDSYGHRIELAAQLVKSGYVPAVLVDGPQGPYGTQESDLAIRFITGEGYPAGWFIALPMGAHSTMEEALVVVPELERRHIRNFLLITSDYHSGRAARTFRKVLDRRKDDIAMRVVTSRDEYFHPASWWRDREGRKTTVLEWAKTVASALGL